MATSARLDELKKKFDENPRRYFAPLANEYRKLGDLTQAIALCRAHLPNQPGHISGHIVLAQALYEARDLGEARQIFEAALELDPENLIALRFLGDIAREQDEPLQARGWYERVLEADPRNEEIALMLRDLETPSAESTTMPIGPETAASPGAAFTAAPVYEAAEAPAPPTFTWSTEPIRQETHPAGESESVDAGASWASVVSTSPLAEHAEGHAEFGAEEPAAERGAELPDDSSVESLVEFPEPEAILHDLPAKDAPLSFFESTTSDEEYLSAADREPGNPFFGAAESAGTLASEEVDGIVGAPVDDWFASQSDPFGALSSTGNDLPESDLFEQSFLPEVLHATPAETRAVAGASDPEAAPLYVDDTPPAATADMPPDSTDRTPPDTSIATLFTIPTPTFLRAVPEGEGEDAGKAEFELPPSDVGAPAFVASTRGSELDAVHIRDEVAPDELDIASFADYPPDQARASMSVEPFTAAADKPVDDSVVVSEGAHLQEGRHEELADQFAGAFVEAFVIDGEYPIVASRQPSVPVVDDIDEVDDDVDDVDAPTLDVEVIAEVPADVAQWENGPVDPTIAPVEMEGVGEVDSWGLPLDEPLTDDDFVVEYGEFVAPAVDDVAYIANAVSVPLDSDHSYTAGDPPECVSDSFAQFPDQDAERLEELVGVELDSGVERDDPVALPIEGLVTRDVAFEPEADVDDQTADASQELDEAPAFVTETMAELYLQQGFHAEALAIYQQLLVQHPDDPALHDRVAALERGAASTVVDGIVPRDAIDREGQSIRQFFAHFARRQPRRRAHGDVDGSTFRDHGNRVADAAGHGGFAGVANSDEALTEPDLASSTSSLTQLFSSGVVSSADEEAASGLASAFGGHESAPASRSAERELSLEHLFRDVPSRSSGAVTLDEFFQGASPGDHAPASPDSEDGEERGADIEQFTAWLEGLKKK